MLIPELKPAIYGLIAESLVNDIGTDCGRASDHDSRKAQNTLMRLAQASKVRLRDPPTAIELWTDN